jgi:hypothetical protein
MSSLFTELRGLGEEAQPTAVERKNDAMNIVRTFWETYGEELERENGAGSFKYSLVVKMKELYQNMQSGNGKEVHRKIRDILGEQRSHLMQFQSCVDAFNRYLRALSLLDTMIQHGI